jgi:hypothetical protein
MLLTMIKETDQPNQVQYCAGAGILLQIWYLGTNFYVRVPVGSPNWLTAACELLMYALQSVQNIHSAISSQLLSAQTCEQYSS